MDTALQIMVAVSGVVGVGIMASRALAELRRFAALRPFRKILAAQAGAIALDGAERDEARAFAAFLFRTALNDRLLASIAAASASKVTLADAPSPVVSEKNRKSLDLCARGVAFLSLAFHPEHQGRILVHLRAMNREHSDAIDAIWKRKEPKPIQRAIDKATGVVYRTGADDLAHA